MGTGLYKKGRFFAAMGIVVFLCIYGTAIKVHAYACSKCFSTMAEVCVKNKEDYEADYHNYGFFVFQKALYKGKGIVWHLYLRTM